MSSCGDIFMSFQNLSANYGPKKIKGTSKRETPNLTANYGPKKLKTQVKTQHQTYGPKKLKAQVKGKHWTWLPLMDHVF